MPIQSRCPECETQYTLPDEKKGKKVRCRECEEVFTVKAIVKKRSSRSDIVLDTTATRSGAHRKPSSSGVSKSRSKPSRKSSPVLDTEVEEKPASNNVPWLVGGGLAALLIIVGGVVAVVAMSGDDDNKTAQASTQPKTPPVTPPVVRPPVVTPPVVKPPVVTPTVTPPPVKPPVTKPPVTKPPVTPPPTNRGELTREVLDKVKRATVLLRVTTGAGSRGTGSGFFAIAPGIVLTNAHVLGMLQKESTRPRKLEVVINSGQKDERTVGARILGVDRSSDLAVLDIGKGVQAPTPLKVAGASHLFETQKVFVIGFPLGERLGREVSVRQSSVAALRKSSRNSKHLERVQLNGGMDPGNSGGPVVDSTGSVVGVSVAGIVGTQIVFAIPGERVHTILNGRISTMAMAQPFESGTAVGVPVSLVMLDPRQAIKEVALDIWVGRPGKPRDPSEGKPSPAMPGHTRRRWCPNAARK